MTVTHPHLTIAKSPDEQTIENSAPVTFSITVTNDGDVALDNVEVTDVKAPNCNRAIGTLAPGAHSSYQCTLSDVRESFTNVASAKGKPAVGMPRSSAR